MEIKKIRTIPPQPAREEEYVAAIRCDLCGIETRGSSQRTDGVNWLGGSYEFDRTRISRSIGSSYPEGGQSEKQEYHVCPECWESKLVPWFQSQGAEPTESESVW